MNRRYKLSSRHQSAVGRLYRNDVILNTRLCLSTSSHSVYRWMKPGYHSGAGGFLSIKGKGITVSTHHQKHDSQATTRLQLYSYPPDLEFQPDTFQQMAGLAYYYNTRHFYYLFMSWEESLQLCAEYIRQ